MERILILLVMAATLLFGRGDALETHTLKVLTERYPNIPKRVIVDIFVNGKSIGGEKATDTEAYRKGYNACQYNTQQRIDEAERQSFMRGYDASTAEAIGLLQTQDVKIDVKADMLNTSVEVLHEIGRVLR